MSFSDLGLSRPILDAIASKGYSMPSPIQAQAIPAILEGHDLMAAAQTGTGKTAGFTLPLLQRLSEGQPAKGNQVRALILTPTRELAAQVGDSVSAYSVNLKLRSTVVFGGVKINPQLRSLRGGVDILVATPGRLLDLYQQNAIRFNTLEVLVLDEADRMLDMGFIHDIKRILALLPKQRQNLLFSATFSDQIRTLAKSIVTAPVEISVTPVNSTATTVSQKIYPVDKNQKANLLTTLISDNQWQQVLVFSRTKHGANRLARQLEKTEISAAAIHGNKSQGARTKALADFRSGQVRVLVATDIAARGLDINQLPHVVNFDLPNVAEDYVHRIGRTGRAGASGHAVSLVCADEFEHLTAIEQLTGKIIEREIIDGFAPVHALPESDLSRKPAKKKTSKAKAKPARNQGQNKGHEDGQRSAANARGHKPPGKNKGHRVRKQSTEGQASSAGSSNSGHKTGGNTGNTANQPAARPARRSRSAQAGQISKPAQNTSRDSNANTRQGTGHNSNRTQAPAANKPVRRTRKRPAPKPAAA